MSNYIVLVPIFVIVFFSSFFFDMFKCTFLKHIYLIFKLSAHWIYTVHSPLNYCIYIIIANNTHKREVVLWSSQTELSIQFRFEMILPTLVQRIPKQNIVQIIFHKIWYCNCRKQNYIGVRSTYSEWNCSCYSIVRHREEVHIRESVSRIRCTLYLYSVGSFPKKNTLVVRFW